MKEPKDCLSVAVLKSIQRVVRELGSESVLTVSSSLAVKPAWTYACLLIVLDSSSGGLRALATKKQPYVQSQALSPNETCAQSFSFESGYYFTTFRDVSNGHKTVIARYGAVMTSSDLHEWY